MRQASATGNRRPRSKLVCSVWPSTSSETANGVLLAGPLHSSGRGGDVSTSNGVPTAQERLPRGPRQGRSRCVASRGGSSSDAPPGNAGAQRFRQPVPRSDTRQTERARVGPPVALEPDTSSRRVAVRARFQGRDCCPVVAVRVPLRSQRADRDTLAPSATDSVEPATRIGRSKQTSTAKGLRNGEEFDV